MDTVREEGHVDMIIRDEPPAFVQVLDSTAIYFAERTASRRANTMISLLASRVIGVVALLVLTDRVSFHCGKAIKRASSWGGRYQIERSDFPPSAQILRDQAGSGDVQSVPQEIGGSYANRMY